MRACSLGNHTLPRSVMNSARSKPAEPLMEKDKGGGGGVAGGVELAGGGGGHGEAILNVTQTLACRRVLFPTFLIDNDNNSGDTWKHRRPIKGLRFCTGVAFLRFARL